MELAGQTRSKFSTTAFVSSNDYDWLGEGVYFFQDAPLRALQWAKEQYPEDPVVIRSLIRLENSIDLFDIKWFATLKASRIIEDHFANLTDDEFIDNLKEYCPRIFNEGSNSEETDLDKNSSGKKEINKATSLSDRTPRI
jgi:hypothetical protein